MSHDEEVRELERRVRAGDHEAAEVLEALDGAAGAFESDIVRALGRSNSGPDWPQATLEDVQSLLDKALRQSVSAADFSALAPRKGSDVAGLRVHLGFVIAGPNLVGGPNLALAIEPRTEVWPEFQERSGDVAAVYRWALAPGRIRVPLLVAWRWILLREAAGHLPHRENPSFDEELRDLERRGAAGDLDALQEAARLAEASNSSETVLRIDVARLKAGVLPLNLTKDRLKAAVLAVVSKDEFDSILEATKMPRSYLRTHWAWQDVAGWLQLSGAPVRDDVRSAVPGKTLDELRVGTPLYAGIGYFWHYEYRYPLRDVAQAVRKRVHDAFLEAGLELKGESAEHLAIIERLTAGKTRNPADEERRDLERRVAGGDEEAELELARLLEADDGKAAALERAVQGLASRLERSIGQVLAREPLERRWTLSAFSDAIRAAPRAAVIWPDEPVTNKTFTHGNTMFKSDVEGDAHAGAYSTVLGRLAAPGQDRVDTHFGFGTPNDRGLSWVARATAVADLEREMLHVVAEVGHPDDVPLGEARRLAEPRDRGADPSPEAGRRYLDWARGVKRPSYEARRGGVSFSVPFDVARRWVVLREAGDIGESGDVDAFRKNPGADETLRELERAARAGGFEERLAYVEALDEAGRGHEWKNWIPVHVRREQTSRRLDADLAAVVGRRLAVRELTVFKHGTAEDVKLRDEAVVTVNPREIYRTEREAPRPSGAVWYDADWGVELEDPPAELARRFGPPYSWTARIPGTSRSLDGGYRSWGWRVV